jgi:hypothetical protein
MHAMVVRLSTSITGSETNVRNRPAIHGSTRGKVFMNGSLPCPLYDGPRISAKALGSVSAPMDAILRITMKTKLTLHLK